MNSEIASPNLNTTTTTATSNGNPHAGMGVGADLTADPNLPTVDEQRQYKVQLLLHINSILLARVIQMNNSLQNSLQNNINNSNNENIIRIQQLISQFLKRVHANLQCISQINQGIPSAKPLILSPLN
ncbi:hypothetical protein N7582_000280 [Saccharomyces uvarum]|nr:hypothetical protein N7582_000280 [Saccharomyces uvarum]